MSLSFQDLQEALTLDDRDEFVIWQNSSKRNKRVKRGNLFASKGVTVRGKFIDAESGDDVGVIAVNAQIAAELAEADAEAAQAAANGKNRIFYNSGRPDTAGSVGDYELIDGDLWFDISAEANYAMYTWNDSLVEDNKWELREIADLSIARVNVGKLIAGFVSSQVFELANSDAYIQSSTFVETWTNSKLYKTEKNVPSDVTKVKVESSDGTWRIYECASQHTSAGSPATFPGAGGLWTDITDSYPTRTLTVGDRTYTLPDCGFRIVGNGTAELNNVKIRGAVVSQIGFFGDTENAVRIDDKGLTIGNDGYIKSRGVGYNGTSFFATSGTSGGFFLGNTQAEGQEELYQLFIGKPAANSLWWNGTDLIINGKIGLPEGGDEDSDAGLEITSGFGIRRSSRNKVLTITGGDGNGITFGSQIDLVGTQFAGAGGNAEGQLILSGGYDSSLDPVDPSRDGCIIFRTSREDADENIGVVRARIDLDGTFRIINAGNAHPDAPDEGAGNLVVDNEVEAVAYNSTSSKRFKKKIKNLKNGLGLVKSLRPVTFDWKNKKRTNDIGLIAEEVNKVLPMIIGKNTKGEVSSLDYGKLTTILIQAVKELSVEVEKLKSKIG